MSVGIERLAVYVPNLVLPVEALAAARGVPAAKLTQGLGVREIAVVPSCEDVVTMAATAGARVLRAARVEPDDIGLLVVATESAVDHAKPVAIFVHELLGIAPHCRVYEVKHACYAGTAALMAALDWTRAGGVRRRRALVIATDTARYELGSAAEPTQGAGAVAILVGNEPQVLMIGDDTGTFAKSVYDFWRPLDSRTALVDGELSVECYLDALSGAFASYRRLERPALEPNEGLTDRLARVLYHTPFPKLVRKAHRRLLEVDWQATQRWDAIAPRFEESAEESFAELVAPGLEAVSRVGNMYTASLYFCLAAVLEADGRRLGGRRLGLFSYGSGCCSEFFSGWVPATVANVADSGVAGALAQRTVVDVAEYERLTRAAETGGEPPEGFRGEFVLRGVRDGRREYAARAPRMAA